MSKSTWLKQQFEKTTEDVKKWPAWMRREASKMNNRETEQKETTQNPPPSAKKEKQI